MRTVTALLPAALALLAGASPTLQAAELRLRLLETTDVHMNLLNCWAAHATRSTATLEDRIFGSSGLSVGDLRPI